MFPITFPRFFLLAAGVAALLSNVPRLSAADPAGGEWREVSHQPNLVIYMRERAGTSAQEVRAIGTIEAPNWVIKNVLDDTEHYANFMPYMLEAHVISRDSARHTVTAYARVAPPLISERDYTLTVHDESHRKADGTIIYKTRWEPATDKAPPEKAGVVRVKVNEGTWQLDPIDNGQRTRGTYVLFTDGGGGIPSFIFNQVSKSRVKELFEVIGKQAQEAKYRQSKPPLP